MEKLVILVCCFVLIISCKPKEENFCFKESPFELEWLEAERLKLLQDTMQ